MKSVGQPKKNIIDALQTIFWYRYLETGIVAKIFEKEFSEFCLENKIDIKLAVNIFFIPINISD